jgi:hypothetical protein
VIPCAIAACSPQGQVPLIVAIVSCDYQACPVADVVHQTCEHVGAVIAVSDGNYGPSTNEEAAA